MLLIYKGFTDSPGPRGVARFPHRRAALGKCGSAFSACALLFLLATTNAQAAPTAAEQIDQAIASHMQQELDAQARREAWKGMRHSLSTTLLNNAESLAPCAQPLQVERRSDDPSPLERQRLEVKCADQAGWQVVALVQANVQLPVVHAATVIERGQTISAEQLQLQNVNIARNVRGFYNDPQDVIGQGAKRRIRNGQLIAPNLLSEPLLVRRGQQVTVVASQDGISASVSGEALANGRAGEVIRVRNIGSQKVIEAQVVEEGVVTSTFR